MPNYQYVPPESSQGRKRREAAEEHGQRQRIAAAEYASLRILQAALPRLKEYGSAALYAIEIEQKLLGFTHLKILGGWVVGSYHYPGGNGDFGDQEASTATIILGEDGHIYNANQIQRNGIPIMQVRNWAERFLLTKLIRQHQSRNVSKSVLHQYTTAIVVTFQHPESMLIEVNKYLPEHAQILGPDVTSDSQRD